MQKFTNEYYIDISNRFKEFGVSTVWLPYTKGISSTKLRKIDRAYDKYKDKNL